MERTEIEGPPRRAYSVTEAATMYAVSPAWLRQRIKEGSLRARRAGRRVLLMDEDLSEFFDRMTVPQKHAVNPRA